VNYHWNWRIFWESAPDASGTYFGTLISGLYWTVSTALCAWAIALALGAVVGTLRTAPVIWLARLANAYVEIFRNIPLLVQMFLWFFVLPELLPKALGDAMKQMPPPWSAWIPAVLCLGTYTSARVAEQVRAGILSLPRGQSMAGIALGLTLPQTYRHVILPMAFRIIMPPLGSEFTSVIKNSAVALTIGVMELTARARSMQEFTFQVFEAFTAATLIYLLLNLVVFLFMRWIERKVAVPGLIGTDRVLPQAGH
jgi:glutamate/aspartate transport system permease protein